MTSTKIPEALRTLNQWICWRLEKRDDKSTKIPYRVTGALASSTDASTWASFDEAVSVVHSYSGLGFVFSPEDPFTGVDFDCCRDKATGKIADWAKPWIKKLNSYSEVSPSGTGVKVWVRGKLPFTSGKNVKVKGADPIDGKDPGVEAYDHGRYFAVTGLRMGSLPPEPQDRQHELTELCQHFFGDEGKARQDDRSSRLSVIERARKYVDSIPGALSGSGGHSQTFKVACILVLGFCLTPAEAFVILAEYNLRCEPPWKERDIRHKIDSASKQPGPRGYLRDATDCSTVSIPKYQEHAPAQVEQPAPVKTSTLQDAAVGYLDKITSSKQSLLSLGIPQVDYAIGGGMEYGEMVIIAARPSHGKSAFALQCMHHLGLNGIPTAIVSEEMSGVALGKRTVQYATRLGEAAWLQGMVQVKQDLNDHFSMRAPAYVIESSGTTIRAAEEIKRLHDTKGVRVVVIDYAQLLGSPGKTRYEQITQTSISLRQLASSTGILLLVLCQLSRTIEQREKFIPRLEDLKDTGQLEQDADVILFLVWPYRLDTRKNPAEYQVWIGKNRNRPINAPEVDCQFDPSRQRILTASGKENLFREPRWMTP